jgi:predicted DNA-binding mobile mystery protein A
VSGGVTLNTLQRAAEALGCRFVYALVPEQPLEDTVRSRAQLIAARQLAAVEHTMRLEDQSVTSKKVSKELLQRRIEDLMLRPARLWDEK